MRVVVAHHVADDLGALAVLGVRGEPRLPHRVEDAALNGLQPVAYVRQRAARDDGERVVEVTSPRQLVQRDVFHRPRFRLLGAPCSFAGGSLPVPRALRFACCQVLPSLLKLEPGLALIRLVSQLFDPLWRLCGTLGAPSNTIRWPLGQPLHEQLRQVATPSAALPGLDSRRPPGPNENRQTGQPRTLVNPRALG